MSLTIFAIGKKNFKLELEDRQIEDTAEVLRVLRAAWVALGMSGDLLVANPDQPKIANADLRPPLSMGGY